ncbi:redoxin domain-containing protein [Microcoleus sp. C2C3]|uniref:redoxin domain-containing protein n=1 Tax=unclassified Microcoleus TaxID=2642155 RepID=UPI002FD500B3
MTIIAHPAQDPEKRTRGFKSLGIRVRSGRHVFNLKRIFLYTLDKDDKGRYGFVSHAPVFSLPHPRGLLAHILADFRGRRVLLYFYPRDNTPGCATQSPKSRRPTTAVTESKKLWEKNL